MYFTLIVIAVNLLVDLAYGYFDPGFGGMTETSAHIDTALSDSAPPVTGAAALGPTGALRQPLGVAALATSSCWSSPGCLPQSSRPTTRSSRTSTSS